ncbi:DegT/DnrJ/EryC1/StrS family aminotransferase [Delftia sp. RIT313]|uniref:DegT/DnrJ/EryC1/StrS family aminotransferase n=1 Tax=Delftia sp. RIT313 TaxID=1468410 RepID=UPI00044A9ADF|nr:DegT/DnrJ/EryC1/StrS family aminotransferase [Delftia sp. RIT313]EZP54001.1 UDP-3-keto-D-GlcNAcA aminotransferase [Delftia sp. RIT313]
MQINNLSEKINAYEAKIKAATSRVIDSGWLVLGPEVKRFENLFAEYLGAQYCVSLANGTDAIELSLRALGVESGDIVATVANAGMYTTTALLAIGAIPFFIDVDLTTRNTTLKEVQRALDAGVKAVVVTHLYGRATPEIKEIAQQCALHGVPLLEDCAQSHGASIGDQRTGTFGDASSFSFYPTKNLGALGDGGAVVTNRNDIAEKVARLRQYGWSSKYCVEYGGARNSRLDEIQAAILAVFLPDLDAANERRRHIAKRYSLEIKHTEITLPPIGSADYVAHLYVIQSSKRNLLQAYLKGFGISSDIHYPIPDYRQPLFKDKFAEIGLKNTERLCSEILTLPCYPEMNDSLVDQVISAVNAWEI